MNSIKLLLLVLFSIASTHIYSQKDLSNFKNIEGVYIISHWGDLNIEGTVSGDSPEFNVEAIFTDTSRKPKNINNFLNYMSFELKEKKLYIETRKPKDFESIDLNLKIPADLFIEITLKKGGNISVYNFLNGTEINSLNGSVTLEGISEYAIVNATNGEIKASFDKINSNQPISLVTLNGGVTVKIPEKSKRDLRLISRKNGYIESDFDLDTEETMVNLNQKRYAKQAIINRGKINGGGSLLFLSTENGPIAIKKSKS